MHLRRALDERFNPLLSGLDGRVARHRVNPRILISTSSRFVFYRIPKAGHSTVGNTLLNHDPGISQDQRDAIRGRGDKIGGYRHPREVGIRVSREAWRHYFLFTFVRNPFHRTLSAYLDKVVRGRPPARKHLGAGQYSSAPDEEPPGFAGFLARLEQGDLYRGPHWAPQVALLPRDRRRLDHVGHLERIDEDLPELLHRLFDVRDNPEIANWDPHRTDSTQRLAEYYDGRSIDRIRRLYREDFDAFGYSFDPDRSSPA
ncbi:sulfotransferase family protein [Thioalkalivibrio sp. ALE20]|uniref:sulfotransferase family protein n=1 Tax=Thioalkalivibrio sp. ALE20 TaxID=545275 RepID=UPI000367C93B|nr:sulfotransferase family protein [Thioalkalivibrio sp. ALE20]